MAPKKKDSEFLTNSAIETQKTQKFGVNSEILTPLEPLGLTGQLRQLRSIERFRTLKAKCQDGMDGVILYRCDTKSIAPERC